jgi:hypothetical protein
LAPSYITNDTRVVGDVKRRRRILGMSGKFHGKWRIGLLLSGLLAVLVVSALLAFHSSTAVKVSASSNIWPNTAGPGSTITVSGSDYLSDENVQVYFQYPSQGIIKTMTDASGSFLVPLTIPKTYVQGTQYYVHVNSNTYSTQLLFNFTALNLSLSNPNDQLSFGSLTSFSGHGFVANETVDLVWNYGAIGMSTAGTIVAGSDGSFNTPLTLPSVPYNSHFKLVATGRTSRFSTSTSLTASPGIVLTPSSGSAGTVVSLNGGSFGSDELVNVLYLNNPVATARTNIDGAFTASFTLADSNEIGYQPDAIQVIGKTTGVSAVASFLSQPSISISPTSGKAGTVIRVKGKHFTASDTLNIYWVNESMGTSANQTFIGNVRVSSNGTFTITITAPAGVVKGGLYLVQAIDQKTGKGGQAQFKGK